MLSLSSLLKYSTEVYFFMKFRSKQHGMRGVGLKSRYIFQIPKLSNNLSNIVNYNSFFFQELLSFNHPHVMSQRLLVENFEKNVERLLNSPLDEIVILHLMYS